MLLADPNQRLSISGVNQHEFLNKGFSKRPDESYKSESTYTTLKESSVVEELLLRDEESRSRRNSSLTTAQLSSMLPQLVIKEENLNASVNENKSRESKSLKMLEKLSKRLSLK
jgi:hypothetical protein